MRRHDALLTRDDSRTQCQGFAKKRYLALTSNPKAERCKSCGIEPVSADPLIKVSYLTYHVDGYFRAAVLEIKSAREAWTRRARTLTDAA